MFNEKLGKCPACGSEMELGFSIRSSPLSFVTSEKIQKFIHMTDDLHRVGFVKMFLPWTASYDIAYHCVRCRIFIVDYSKAISSKEAKTQAASVSPFDS
jgi:hypothetical protein